MLAHPLEYNPDVEEDVSLLAKAILHAIDIGNVVRKFDVALLFSERIHKEFRLQVAEERRLGLPVAPHMDVQDNTSKVRMELTFMELISKPIWARLAEIAPGLQERMQQLDENISRMRRMCKGCEGEQEERDIPPSRLVKGSEGME